uniref:Uncharacterized protein n=1 Tax=Amphimedon queenslandica TaxID=400682 RepID=A0A1X7SIJ0_AMPQE
MNTRLNSSMYNNKKQSKIKKGKLQ